MKGGRESAWQLREEGCQSGDLRSRGFAEGGFSRGFRQVRQLLLDTDYTLPQIAELTGIQYHEYLVRFFKKRTGLTPGAFRRNSKPKSVMQKLD